ncbi:MAG: hypothetical protein H6657_20040 [Ardenticatenaceae bacterium]|nr:hypothetical protein [Ardenticatenaceae bacterium]
MNQQSSNMSHEEYVYRQQQRVVQVAEQILNQEIGLIEGTRLLSRLRGEVTEGQFDPDFTLFIGIDSETDALPVGDERQFWADSVLLEKDKEIRRLEDFYRDNVVAACKVLISRFGE